MNWLIVLIIYTIGCFISHLLEEKYPSGDILKVDQDVTPDMIKTIMYFRIILWPLMVIIFIFGGILRIFGITKD